MDNKKFGDKIAKLRKEKGMTQTELAKILNISNKTVSRWEVGDGYPEISILVRLSKILGVSIDYLLSESSSEECITTTEPSAAEAGDDGYSKETKWNQLTIFNKIAVVTIGIIAGWFLLCTILMYISTRTSSLEAWLPLMALIGTMVFIVAPVIGSISAIVGVVMGNMNKIKKQTKIAVIMCCLNICLPICWYLIVFFAA